MPERAFASSKKRAAKATAKRVKTHAVAPSNPPQRDPDTRREDFPVLTLELLQQGASDWLFEGKFRGFSPHTLATRRSLVKNLVWFLQDREYSTCGVREL